MLDGATLQRHRAQRCVMCHAGEAPPLGLRLDSMEALLKGSQRGPVAIAGDPAGSELVRRIRGISQPRMPMTGPPFLQDSEIALFERWIAGGLQAAASAAVAVPTAATTALPAPGEPVTYQHVAPIFATRCAKCHTASGLMGPAPEGYRLDSCAATISSTERARVVPTNPHASELMRRVRGQSHPRMPFDGPPYLSDGEIGLIEEWIMQGAADATGKAADIPVGAAVRPHGTLGADDALDGMPLQITPETRIDRRPRSGDYVQVRGRLDEDGGVRVERMRRR